MQNDPTSWVSPIIQLVTAGGFGALVWYLIVKHQPAIDERHRDERAEWLEYIRKRDSDFEELSTKFVSLCLKLEHELAELQEKVDGIGKR